MTDPKLDSHYRRWNQNEIVTRFAEKRADDFFESETRLLKPIVGNDESVIDIGGASGRFVELLNKHGIEPRYTGLDLSEAIVKKARGLYPGHSFYCANALTFESGEKADLINATGVMQHEPHFDELLKRMIAWSQRYVLFDIKLANTPSHLVDINQSYIASTPPMFFVILSTLAFLAELSARNDIQRADIFGYETPRNAKAVIPDDIGQLVSAGVLLEVGTPPDGVSKSPTTFHHPASTIRNDLL